MSVVPIRNLGVSAVKSLLSALNKLLPADHSSYVKDCYIEHMAYNGGYDTRSGILVSTTKNTATITYASGLTVAFSTKCEAGKTYAISCDNTASNGDLYVSFFTSARALVSYVELPKTGGVFTVPSNAEYVLLFPRSGATAMTFTWTLNYLKEQQ